MIKWLLDLLSPGDRVRHMTIGGGIEKGGIDIVYEKTADDTPYTDYQEKGVDDDPSTGWLVTTGEDGKPVWRKVKWTLQG